MEVHNDSKQLSRLLAAFAVMLGMFFSLTGLWFLLLRLLIRD
jgi:hypothetical protein